LDKKHDARQMRNALRDKKLKDLD